MWPADVTLLQMGFPIITAGKSNRQCMIHSPHKVVVRLIISGGRIRLDCPQPELRAETKLQFRLIYSKPTADKIEMMVRLGNRGWSYLRLVVIQMLEVPGGFQGDLRTK